jgi:hypothetical protein
MLVDRVMQAFPVFNEFTVHVKLGLWHVAIFSARRLVSNFVWLDLSH